MFNFFVFFVSLLGSPFFFISFFFFIYLRLLFLPSIRLFCGFLRLFWSSPVFPSFSPFSYDCFSSFFYLPFFLLLRRVLITASSFFCYSLIFCLSSVSSFPLFSTSFYSSPFLSSVSSSSSFSSSSYYCFFPFSYSSPFSYCLFLPFLRLVITVTLRFFDFFVYLILSFFYCLYFLRLITRSSFFSVFLRLLFICRFFFFAFFFFLSYCIIFSFVSFTFWLFFIFI